MISLRYGFKLLGENYYQCWEKIITNLLVALNPTVHPNLLRALTGLPAKSSFPLVN